MIPLLHAGGTDCEAITSWLLDQPVNAVSSLAYVAAAGWLLWSRPRSPRLLVYAVAVSLNGFGGLAYHGSAARSGWWLHDWAILVTLGAMFLVDTEARRGRPFPWPWWAGAAGVLAVVALRPDAALAASAVLAALVVLSEVLLARSGRRAASRGTAYVVLLVALAIAVPVKLLTSSDALLCDSDSLLQGHALWHALTAVAMAAWGAAALTPRDQPAPARR